MKKRSIVAALLCAAVTVSFSACGVDGGKAETGGEETASSELSGNAESTFSAAVQYSEMSANISDRDRDPSYDASLACAVAFSGASAEISGSGASADGADVLITGAGTYVLSGSSENGSVTVSAGPGDKVQLVLNGLSLRSSACPLVIESADKVFVTLAEGSENSLSDGEEYELFLGDSGVDAAVFSKSDMTINGSGSLSVCGNFSHGIVSKDDLVITGGNVSVTAAKTGIEGKDCVILSGGSLSVGAGTDGIRSTNADDAGRGYVLLDGADIKVKAGSDGVQAAASLCIASGSLEVECGSETATQAEYPEYGGFGRGWNSAVQKTETDGKGIKCDGTITVSGGKVVVNSCDASVHAGGDVLISGGELTLSSSDDGVHSDTVVSVSGGKLSVSESYEGIEAGEIYVLGGEIDVASSDDGFNAAGETSDGMLFGKGAFGFSGSEKIVISGGRISVSAGGDGIDSNGSLEFTGGVTLVNGPSDSANGALDCESGPLISGGVVMAVGASGMAVSFSDSSAQGSIQANVSAQPGGGRLYLCGEDGKVLCSMDTEKAYNSVIVSCPELEAGKTYVLCAGDGAAPAIADGEKALSGESAEVIARVEMTSLHYSDSSGGGMGGGFKGGGMGKMNPGAGKPGGF